LAIGWYVGSKILEHFDLRILGLSGGTVSGHSLKHLAAAVAAFLILRMLNEAQNSKFSADFFKWGSRGHL
jgi:hypothetical protein